MVSKYPPKLQVDEQIDGILTELSAKTHISKTEIVRMITVEIKKVLDEALPASDWVSFGAFASLEKRTVVLCFAPLWVAQIHNVPNSMSDEDVDKLLHEELKKKIDPLDGVQRKELRSNGKPEGDKA